MENIWQVPIYQYMWQVLIPSSTNDPYPLKKLNCELH